jgi:hypothetical protein
LLPGAGQLNAFGEMRLALGLPETATPDQVVAAVKAARQAQITGERAIRQAHIDKLVTGRSGWVDLVK